MRNKFTQENLVILYGYKCNYKCNECTTGSNNIRDKSLDPDLDTLLQAVPILSELYEVNSMITLSGGEAFLYWDTRIVPLAKAIDKYFPNKRINIFTNGQLLGKHINKFIKLSEEVSNLTLEVTEHLKYLPDTPAGKIWNDNIHMLDTHKHLVKLNPSHYHIVGNINANIYFYGPTMGMESWSHLIQVQSDGKIKPWATKDPAGSMKNGCIGNVCACVVGSKLYKCPLLGTIKDNLTATKQLNDPDWAFYLEQPTVDLFNLRDDDLTLFEEYYSHPIPQCDICPNKLGKMFWNQRTYESIIGTETL